MDEDRARPVPSPLRAPEVGDGIHTLAGSWTFGGRVPDAFDTHVARSVPAYAECHELVADLADQLLPAGGRCYDLGCSTGTLTALLADRLAPRRGEIIGVDREPDMIRLAAERCAELPAVRFETVALEELELEPADLVISFYTLQFVPVRSRRKVVERIHQALKPAGAMILFEKVLAPTARTQEIATGAYFDWKRRQGFSENEIAAKAHSIRGVLAPLTPEENREMLLQAGFAEAMQVFRWVLFEGIVAYA